MRVPLTDLGVRNLKPPARGTLTIWDSNVRGLGLRCSQGGAKTFIVMLGKERSRLRIGHYPAWSVKEARAQALKTIAERAGKPVQKRVPFEKAFETFLETRAANYRPKVRSEAERIVKKHLIPKIGRKAIGDITTDDIIGITDSLVEKPSTRAHVHALARTIFRWAVRRRLIDRSPLEGVEPPVPPVQRDRVLNDDELRLVYRKAEALRFTGGKIVQLLILTGQRRGEIASLRGEYIDRDNKLVSLPAGFTKNSRTHTFPYGPMAAAIIAELSETGFVFPARGTDDDRPYSGWSKLKTFLEVGIAPWTLHDLRRTFATNLARLGVAPHIIERLLNHVTGTISGVAAIYNRHSYLPEMRAAMQTYEEWLQALLSNTERTNARQHDPRRNTGIHHEAA